MLPSRLPLSFLAGCAAILLLGGCGGEGRPAAGPQPGSSWRGGASGGPAPVRVVVAEARLQEIAEEIEALGTLSARESVTLTAKVTETVSRVNFQDGEEVRAGAILVELSDRAEVANLREAQAALEEADKQLARLRDLRQQGTVGQAQLDQQQALRDQARARVQAIRSRVADRVITAPFSGQLGLRRVSPGTLVTPGTEITTLDDVSSLLLDFSVPETFLSTIGVGDQVVARSAAYRDREFTGKVTSVDSRVNPSTRSFVVRARIPNQERLLKPGMLLTLRLRQAPRQAVMVDELAVTQVGRQAFVFRVDGEGRAEQVPVKLGLRRVGEVEIVEGLAAGDRIVVDGVVKLRPGMPVEPGERPGPADRPPPDAPGRAGRPG